jgi:glycosyltransferase involved in cell wall biosynthesis
LKKTVNIKSICLAGHRFLSERQGGVELQTRYLGKILAEAGWMVHYLSPSLNGKTGHEEVAPNTTVWWFQNRSFSFQYAYSNFEPLFREMKPSVIYQRGRGHLQENGIVLKYARKHGIPLMFALSSDTDLDVFHGFRELWFSKKSLWKKMLLLPYNFFQDLRYRHILKTADVLVTQHEGQYASAKNNINPRSVILRTLHQEIKHVPVKSTTPTILWVSNYRPLKQAELFVSLADKCRDLNAQFILIYGHTKEEYIGPVLKNAKQLQNMTIYGPLSSGDVEKMIEAAWIFVNTSLPVEGFPNTFVQSWLRETPVVSLHVDPGGVLKKERIGCLSGNFNQLVEDVRALLDHQEERLSMGKRARNYAERVHGLMNNRLNYADFFTNVIRQR